MCSDTLPRGNDTEFTGIATVFTAFAAIDKK